MNLKEAFLLLGSQGRCLLEIAKHYHFKEENDIKDFIEFVKHDPNEWFSGFPSRFRGEKSSVVKTAFVKLMKNTQLKEVVGPELCDETRSAVWNTYKQRDHTSSESKKDVTSTAPNPTLEIVDDIPSESEDLHSLWSFKKQKVLPQSKELVLAHTLRQYLEAERHIHPGMASVALTLLDAFVSSESA